MRFFLKYGDGRRGRRKKARNSILSRCHAVTRRRFPFHAEDALAQSKTALPRKFSEGGCLIEIDVCCVVRVCKTEDRWKREVPRSSKQRGLVCRSSFEGIVRAYLRMYKYSYRINRKSRLFTYIQIRRQKHCLEHVEEEAKRLPSTR